MPAQWWIALNQVQPPIRMEYIHAAATSWFDAGQTHWLKNKPYSISPLTQRHGEFGFLIGALVDELSDVLIAQLNKNPTIRLGTTHTQVAKAEIIKSHTWRELESSPSTNQWQVDLLTPTTHRTGSRNSPLPNIPAIIRGLAQHWEHWHGPLGIDSTVLGREVWASDLNLSSTSIEFRRQIISGSLGYLRLRCNSAELAVYADKLLRLAPYCGIGSFTAKGCGVCEVTPIRS